MSPNLKKLREHIGVGLSILYLLARYLKNYLSSGLETWSEDRGWVDYLIKFLRKKSPYLSRVMAI